MTEEFQRLGEPSTSGEGVQTSRRRWPYLLGAILVALLVWNAIVFVPVHRGLADESDAAIIAYRKWLVSPSQVVIDIRSVEGSQSMAGMDRMFFKAAESLQDHSYEGVILAYRGETRFLMDGAYFQHIGATRQTQNPVYTMRTMQEHLSNPDGTPAFGAWSGGWLGVLGKQLEDHNTFHKRWWVDEKLGTPSY